MPNIYDLIGSIPANLIPSAPYPEQSTGNGIAALVGQVPRVQQGSLNNAEDQAYTGYEQAVNAPMPSRPVPQQPGLRRGEAGIATLLALLAGLADRDPASGQKVMAPWQGIANQRAETANQRAAATYNDQMQSRQNQQEVAGMRYKRAAGKAEDWKQGTDRAAASLENKRRYDESVRLKEADDERMMAQARELARKNEQAEKFRLAKEYNDGIESAIKTYGSLSPEMVRTMSAMRKDLVGRGIPDGVLQTPMTGDSMKKMEYTAKRQEFKDKYKFLESKRLDALAKQKANLEVARRRVAAYERQVANSYDLGSRRVAVSQFNQERLMYNSLAEGVNKGLAADTSNLEGKLKKARSNLKALQMPGSVADTEQIQKAQIEVDKLATEIADLQLEQMDTIPDYIPMVGGMEIPGRGAMGPVTETPEYQGGPQPPMIPWQDGPIGGPPQGGPPPGNSKADQARAIALAKQQEAERKRKAKAKADEAKAAKGKQPAPTRGLKPGQSVRNDATGVTIRRKQ